MGVRLRPLCLTLEKYERGITLLVGRQAIFLVFFHKIQTTFIIFQTETNVKGIF